MSTEGENHRIFVLRDDFYGKNLINDQLQMVKEDTSCSGREEGKELLYYRC